MEYRGGTCRPGGARRNPFYMLAGTTAAFAVPGGPGNLRGVLDLAG